MSLRIVGDSITLDFCTHNPTTGSVSDADSLPTCEVFEGTNDTPIATPTVTKRSGKTGNYRVTLTTASWTVGNSYSIVISVTVGGIPKKKPIGLIALDGKRVITLNDIAQTDIVADATPFNGADISIIVTAITLVRRWLTNEVTWDDVNKRFEVWNDAGTSVLFYLKPRLKSGGEVTMTATAFAGHDKVS